MLRCLSYNIVWYSVILDFIMVITTKDTLVRGVGTLTLVRGQKVLGGAYMYSNM